MTTEKTPSSDAHAALPKKSACDLDLILIYRKCSGDDYACRKLNITPIQLEQYSVLRIAQLAATGIIRKAKWIAKQPNYTLKQLTETGLRGTQKQIIFAMQIRKKVNITAAELAQELDASYWIARANHQWPSPKTSLEALEIAACEI